MQAESSEDTLIAFRFASCDPNRIVTRRYVRLLRLGFWAVGTFCLAGPLVEFLFEGGWNTLASRWYIFPLGVVCFALEYFAWWNQGQVCPWCQICFLHWNYRTGGSAYCPRCGRIVNPGKVLTDAPGSMDLQSERSFSDEQSFLKLITLAILLAIKDRSTEVHFEPGRDEFGLRYRCGGILYDLVPPPLNFHREIIATLKGIAGLTQERFKQTGNLEIRIDGHTIHATIEVEPNEVGEQVVIRLPEFGEAKEGSEAEF